MRTYISKRDYLSRCLFADLEWDTFKESLQYFWDWSRYQLQQPGGGGGDFRIMQKRMMQFSLLLWCGYLHQPKKYYNDSLSFYFGVFKC